MLSTTDQAALIRMPLHEGLLGISKAIREANELVQRLARSDLTVLITGESGTGKDIAARMLHRLSPRYGKPFVKVNCPAIPESILESELFGYERGAFTGARSSKPGRFELANRGTIFLDEIAETSYAIQGKLLQILDGESFMRIGGITPIKTDVRIVAATNIALDDIVRLGRMREDMFYRLSDVIVRMPSLRSRAEDIPLLTEHFNYHFSAKLGKDYQPVDAETVRRMCDLPWPGNVRELAARVKQFVATRDPKTLLEEAQDLPLGQGRGQRRAARDADALRARKGCRKGDAQPPRLPSLKEAVRHAVEAAERSLIEEALRMTLWNRRKAAAMLDISYSSLLRRIDAYNIGKTKQDQRAE
ncbi:MAG TPA: sigma-54 dependent transcriptional regulator [Candidatus Hydrogenedentes bacterium]|nr:sigma-54 dependent transcriptional regulator [Candidatus Hydrogenedentota bacterium]